MRGISEPFIRRPVTTVLLTISAVLFGILAYMNLPVNDLPSVDYPVIQVSVNYPGASPETMANNVATPLERQFMQIPGLEMVTSTNRQGSTSMTLQFVLSKSIDAAATDVQTAITQATGSLPLDLPSPPTFSKTNPNDQPIQYIGLTTDSLTKGRLYDYASTNVGQRISTVYGVSRVQVFGTKGAVRIKADPDKLASRGMAIDDLANAIRQGTSYLGAGQFDGPQRSFLLQPKGQLESAESYNNLIIKNVNSSPVYLRDVAVAQDTVEDERINMRFWVRGYSVPSSTVVVAVYRQAGSNAVEVASKVRDELKTIERELPSSVRMILIHDRSKTIVNSVKDVEETLFIAFVLVILVIYVFLGRATDTLIPVVALPLSILITFIVMNALGYSLNNLTLMALTLAVGFLVDDAIVFLENTVRRMEHGEPVMEATLNSAKEISFTIIAMTISLATVFLPLVAMSGLIGRIFREFAVTIIVSIFASGIVSLTLTPLMCSRLLGARGKGHRQTLMERAFDLVEKPVLHTYGKALWFFIHHRWVSAVIWVVCLAGTLYLFQLIPKGFLPVGDSSFSRGVMIAQEGTSFKEMHRYQMMTESILQSDPNVDMTFTVTGISGFLDSNYGFTLAFLKEPQERNPKLPIEAITGGFFMKGMGMPGALLVMQPDPVLSISTGATSNTLGKYAFAISGISPKEVYETHDKMMAKFQGNPMFQSVRSDYQHNTPTLEINILRDQAAQYGVSVSRIEQLLNNAFAQNYVYLIKQPTDQYRVILEARDKDRDQPDDLEKLFIRSDDGARLVPLKAVATWNRTLGPQMVSHLNQFTSTTFSFNLNPGVPESAAMGYIEKVYEDVAPPTVRGALQGEAQTFKETMSSLTMLMILAVFVMYVILGILYESYIHPVTVLSSLPVALIGALATLILFNEVATLYAFVGMFMLMGIVKKNGIMVVDFALQRIAQGQKADVAIHEASVDRFRPILMTTLAAVMGAVPIALGWGADGASRRGLGLVIVGGLIVAQLVTLFVTPAIYLYLEMFQEKVLDRIPFFRSSHHMHGVKAEDDESPLPINLPNQPH